MSKKRVVITGMAALTPLGGDYRTSWDNLLAMKSGIGPITRFDASAFSTRIAGEVKNFDPEAHGISPKLAKRMDRFVQFGVSAAFAALKHSGLPVTEKNCHRIGCMLGIGLGGLDTIETFHSRLLEAGPNKVSPFMIPMLISNMAPGQTAILAGIKGTNVVMTSACSSGLHAIGHAYCDILLGRSDALLTGGVESTITPMGISGFTALKALSSRNDDPVHASRPFDRERDGFVMGEGAGILVVEELEHAKRRGAAIYAEIAGFGATSDAFHITAPAEDGSGLAMAMKNAMDEAGVAPGEIDHINAHGTSTPLNDACETRSVKAAFGKRAYDIPICATKSQTGHLLGAAGGVESIFTILALQTGIIPGTANYAVPDPDCDLNYMVQGPRKLDPRCALCNSAGFGSTNASILYKRWEE
jgi:3-oxoacyl-[acyl-carrier-protein] synthase II